jgi:transcriptional regulator with XRE-family HTH domain
MQESFGARLRQQRERQQITLAAIAEQTKISLSLMEGLERDDVSHWPTGIFRRSFIRAYAQMVGLDPDTVVREFLELYPDPAEAGDALPSALESAAAGHRPPTRLRYVVDAALRSLSRIPPQLAQQPPTPSREASTISASAAPLPEVAPEAAAELNVSSELDAAPQLSAIAPADLIPMAEGEPSLSAVAHLCTQLARVLALRDVEPLLESAAAMLDAAGLIVWIWDPQATALRPALAHGYSDETLAKLPRVRRDTDNATAASFRSSQPRIVASGDQTSGAVVMPLLTPGGCVGVLAVELRRGREQKESVRALAAIFAAQLAASVGFAPLADAVNA